MNRRVGGSTGPSLDLRLLLSGGSTLGLGDGPLLDRVLAGPGPAAEAAFATLVTRHGLMVARVCGGILGDHHAAEDATQAVFLVLLRRARSIRDPDRLAPWLHGVALRTAREARRRQRREPTPLLKPDEDTLIDPTQTEPLPSLLQREQAEILHDAISRLPGRYLNPIVLCDLEGLTQAEAAEQLRCPLGTVAVRLKRGRERLRARLARHHLDLDALSPIVAATLPRPIAASASASAHLLANRVLKTAASVKWKAAAVAAMVAGSAAVATQASSRDEPGSKPAGVGAMASRDDSPPPQSKRAPNRIAPPPVKVEIGYPTVRDVVDFADYNGHVAAERSAEIRAHLNGVLREAPIQDGDMVEQGSVLFRIHDASTEDGLREKSPELAASRERMLREEESRDRIAADLKATGEEKDRANLRYDTATAKYRATLDELNRTITEATTIRAPFSGQITRRSVDVGATVEVGKTPLATISTVDPIRMDFEMDERTYLKIRRWRRTRPEPKDLAVRVGLADEDGYPRSGRVRFEAVQFDPKKGICTLHAELPNPDRSLVPGLFARVEVDYGDPRPGMLIPDNVIVGIPGGMGIWVVDDRGLARRRLITLGSLYGEFREITGGIDAKTRIILKGQESLMEGQPIDFPAEPPAP